MTSEMKCPYCETELEKMPGNIRLLGCPKCLHVADGLFWVKVLQANQVLKFFKEEIDRSATALIERTKELDKCQKDLKESQQATLENAQTVLEIHKDLEIARKALDEIANGTLAYPEVMARETLELIEHKA